MDSTVALVDQRTRRRSSSFSTSSYVLPRRPYSGFLPSFIVGILFGVAFSLIFYLNIQITSLRTYDDVDAGIQAVRVLCWVMTHPVNHKTYASAVKNSWGKRCNKLLFLSSAQDPELGSVNLNLTVPEGPDGLWAKTKSGFQYIWEHHANDADWFMKVDDDTYVIVENLKAMLRDKNSSKPIYYGCQFDKTTGAEQEGYMGGGSGYVLSKEALRRFVEVALTDPDKCGGTEVIKGVDEDVEMGKCMASVGVNLGDTRDELGRYRFLPMPYQFYMQQWPNVSETWYWDKIHHSQDPGPNCCSESVISLHYVTPGGMQMFEYLLYGVKIGKAALSPSEAEPPLLFHN